MPSFVILVKPIIRRRRQYKLNTANNIQRERTTVRQSLVSVMVPVYTIYIIPKKAKNNETGFWPTKGQKTNKW